jgi:SAM-dependent methyltransferase
MTSGVTATNVARHLDPRSVRLYAQEDGLWPVEQSVVADFMPKPPARVLDVGCGAGRATVGLVQAGYATVAIDLSDPMLAAARARHPSLIFGRMNGAALGFASSVFDGVLFSFNGIDYLHPVSSRLQCMHEICRVLRPGGVFVFSTHNAIGHFFSGGFLYPRGYLNAARMLARQWRNPHIRDWYFRYEEHSGEQYFFSAPPNHTHEQLRTAGFEVLDVRGASGSRESGRIRWREPHVFFAARKPPR